jgi:hypothetical protein
MAKERLPQPSKFITESDKALFKNSPIADVLATHEEQNRRYELIESSPYYHYTIEKPDQTKPDTPFISWEVVSTFYSNVKKQMVEFAKAQSILREQGKNLAERSHSPIEQQVASKVISYETKTLIRGLKAINAADAVPHSNILQRSELARIKAKKFIAGVGKEKPEAFRETLRRYIPRFATHPIPHPDDLIPGEDREEVLSRWRNFTSRDADYLIHPDNIPQGAPLHMVFKIAKEMERQDKNDLAYAIKTHGITKLLEMEREKATQEEAPEIPFFTHLVAGTLPGFSFDFLQLSKRRGFDYEEAVSDTMLQTLERFQSEREDRKNGVATDFLLKIKDYYPDQFNHLLANAIINFAARTRKIDDVKLLRNLQEEKWPGFDEILESVKNHPGRRVLDYKEIEAILNTLPQPENQNPTSNLSDDIKALVGEEDSYSIVQPIKKSIVMKGEASTAIRLDLEPLSETIYARLINVDKTIVRYFPFKLSFSGGFDSFSIDILDKNPPNPAIIEKLQNEVANAIRQQVEKNISQSKTKLTKNTQTPFPDTKPMSTLDSPRATREERMREYQQKKQIELERQQRRTKATSEAEHLPQAQVIYPQQVQEREDTLPPRRIIGLDYRNVIELLGKEKIENIKPDIMVKKIEHLVELASIGNKMLGKRISDEVLNQRELQGESINLRQINWIVDGGTTQIRIYLEDIKDGVFILRGIMSKKSETQQTRYIRQLLLDIVQERKIKPQSDESSPDEL